ncbi:TnsA-like heteromeric transposase endonuclease subunit [Streptomyces sp. NPDC086091]|uniref:TnsA-like heteromeric transposase endonuclease subunit n=1 Tax=Streptomyces sp. NPDC086091 TaxID=3365751 RepID=UPI0038068381
MAPQPALLDHAPVDPSSTGVPWSDTSTLHDLARMHAISADAVGQLVMPPDWSARWTTAWRFGRTLVGFAVRDLGEVDLLSSVPVRRFSWRTDQWHRPGLGYLVSTERHHGFESFEEELLLLAADFSCSLMEALAQPFRLRFRSVNGSVEHIPDYLLLTDGTPWLIDVRPTKRIEPEDEVKFAAAAEVALVAGWNYAVVAGWRDHVVGLIDTFSAGRRRLTDPLQLQEQLLRAAEDGPQPFGTLVARCSLEAVARAHAMHLLWHRRLGLQITGPLTDASTIRRSPSRRSTSGSWWQ